MDRHGLLTITRRLDQACHIAQRKKAHVEYNWEWMCTALYYPESKCPFCKAIIKSPYIWLLKGDRQNQLVGILHPGQGRKACITRHAYAHMLNDTDLCLGSHLNGISLIGSPINLRGTSLGRFRIPWYLKKHWNHTCYQGRTYITSNCGIDDPAAELLEELDA